MKMLKFFTFILFVFFIYPNLILAATKDKDELFEQLALEGMSIGYAGACYAGGTGGDYEYLTPKVKKCLRKKYSAFDDITYTGLIQGAATEGARRAKSSSKQCEQMLDLLVALYKKCGENPQRVYDAKKGFLKLRKKTYGY